MPLDKTDYESATKALESVLGIGPETTATEAPKPDPVMDRLSSLEDKFNKVIGMFEKIGQPNQTSNLGQPNPEDDDFDGLNLDDFTDDAKKLIAAQAKASRALIRKELEREKAAKEAAEMKSWQDRTNAKVQEAIKSGINQDELIEALMGRAARLGTNMLPDAEVDAVIGKLKGRSKFAALSPELRDRLRKNPNDAKALVEELTKKILTPAAAAAGTPTGAGTNNNPTEPKNQLKVENAHQTKGGRPAGKVTKNSFLEAFRQANKV